MMAAGQGARHGVNYRRDCRSRADGKFYFRALRSKASPKRPMAKSPLPVTRT
jgi:hypothetical protein